MEPAPGNDTIPGSADPFQRVLVELRSQREARPSWWLLPVTAVAFFAVARIDLALLDVAVFAAAIAFHELGHFVAMRVIGYRDVRVFFLPFVGAATTGKREDATAWERVVVSLAGPVPGILSAVVLTVGLDGSQFAAVHRAVAALLVINAFNLLPFEPLDGGRVVSTLLFSRGRWHETAFGVASGLALVLFGIALSSVLLSLFGLFALLLAPGRHKLRVDALSVADRFPGLGGRIESNDEETLRALYNQAMRVFHGRAASPRVVATRMRAIHQRAMQKPGGLATTVLGMMGYGLSLVLAIGTAAMFVVRQRGGW